MLTHTMALDDAQRWILSTGAILGTLNGDALDVLGGALRPLDAAASMRSLEEAWGITRATELTAMLEHLLGDGSGYSLGYDLGRAASLSGFGYSAYLLDRETAWSWLARCARRAQGAFESFRAFADDYARGHAARLAGLPAEAIEDDDTATLTSAIATLLESATSPWVTLPFNLPLEGAVMPPSTARTWHVGKQKGADGKTLGDVLARASDGDRIVVSAGTYEESIRVSTEAWDADETDAARVVRSPSVEIVGKGKVVLTSKRGPVVEVSGGGLVLEGIALENGRSRASKDGLSDAAHVVDGFLRLEGCTVKAPAGHGVESQETTQLVRTKIKGSKSGVVSTGLVTLDECTFDDSTHSSVIVQDEGRAYVTECTIRGAGHTGVFASGEAFVRVARSKIERSEKFGVAASGESDVGLDTVVVERSGVSGLLVTDDAGVSGDACTFTTSKGAQIDVIDRGTLLLRASAASGGADVGASFRSGAPIQLLGCTFAKNQLSGIRIEGAARPMIAECVVSAGKKGSALFATSGARGVVVKSELATEGAYATIELGDKAFLTFDECSIRGGKGDAVWVHEHARGHFTLCTVSDSRSVGVRVAAAGIGVLRGCKILRNELANVAVVGTGAHASLVECMLSESRASAVELAKNGSLAVRGGAIERNGEAGIFATDGSTFDVEACELRYNEVHLQVQGARGRLAGCRLNKATGAGVYVAQGSDVRVDACTIFDNGASGIEASDAKTTIEIRRSDVHGNETDLLVYDRARASFEDGALGGGSEYAASTEGRGEIVLRRTQLSPGSKGESAGEHIALDACVRVAALDFRAPWSDADRTPAPYVIVPPPLPAQRFSPCTLVEHGITSSLVFDAFDTCPGLRERLEARGIEANGHGFALMLEHMLDARYPGLSPALRFDPEAGMMSVIGDHEALARVAEMLRDAIEDPEHACADIPPGAFT